MNNKRYKLTFRRLGINFPTQYFRSRRSAILAVISEFDEATDKPWDTSPDEAFLEFTDDIPRQGRKPCWRDCGEWNRETIENLRSLTQRIFQTRKEKQHEQI